MSFIESIKTCVLKYLVFRGRASRSEFWWFVLFFWLSAFLFYPLVKGSLEHLGRLTLRTFDVKQIFEDISIIWFAIFPPLISVTIRRLHDVNISGWWIGSPYLIVFCLYIFEGIGVEPKITDMYIEVLDIHPFYFVPSLITIIILFFTFKKGDKFTNKYGANPNKK